MKKTIDERKKTMNKRRKNVIKTMIVFLDTSTWSLFVAIDLFAKYKQNSGLAPIEAEHIYRLQHIEP